MESLWVDSPPYINSAVAVQVCAWEAKLAAVSETIELLLQVQRNWMYLENIFVGSEDIRKQLPAESALFEGVNVAFAAQMRELRAVGNVLAATTPPRVLAAFQVAGLWRIRGLLMLGWST